MRRGLLALVVAAATLAPAGLPVAAAAAPPRPQAAPAWYAPDVHVLRSLGLAGAGFDPGAPLSRGAFASLVARLFGVPSPRPCVALFGDVPPAAADAGSIAAALRAGWMFGVGYRRFRPDRPVTRAEAVVTLARALGLRGGGPVRFSDAGRIPAWAVAGIRSAVAAGLARGFPDGAFRPDQPLDQAQAARLLAAAFRLRRLSARARRVPAPPKGLGFAPAGGRLQLVWRAVYGARGYVVERRRAREGWCWHAVATGVEPPLATAGFGGYDQGRLRIVDTTMGGVGWGIEVPARPPYGDGNGLDYLAWGGGEIRVAFPKAVPHPRPGDRLTVLYTPTGVVRCSSSGYGWCWPADTMLSRVRWARDGSVPGVAVDPAKGTLTLTTWRLRAGRAVGPHRYRILARSTDGMLSAPSRAVAGPRLSGPQRDWARYGFTPALSLALRAAVRRGAGALVNAGGLRLNRLPALPSAFRDVGGQRLFFADSPEQATRPAVLYRARVRGAVRAYYDVTNLTGKAADVSLVLTDAGPETVAYAVYGGRESANLDVRREGVDVSAAMLKRPRPPVTGRLQPGESVVLDPLSPTIKPSYSLLGYRDLWVGGHARLSFVLAPAPWDAALYRLGHLALAPPATKPWDGAGRGVFSHTLREIDLHPPSGSPSVTHLANGRVDPWVRPVGAGGDAGNYGVTYRIRGRPAVTTALLAVPLGGPYLGVLRVGGAVFQAPRATPPAAYPGAFLFGVWPAGRESTIDWTPPGGSSPTLALVAIPIGGGSGQERGPVGGTRTGSDSPGGAAACAAATCPPASAGGRSGLLGRVPHDAHGTVPQRSAAVAAAGRVGRRERAAAGGSLS